MTTASVSWRGRVALVSSASGPKTGIGRYIQMLQTGLRQAGVDAVRVAPTCPSLPNASYRVFRLLGRDLHAFLRNYPMWCKYPQADIYHFTSQELAALLLFCRPKGRVVVTVHDIFPYMYLGDPHLGSSYYLDHFYVRAGMAGLKRADHIIAVSCYTKQCLVEYLGILPSNITVAYHGVVLEHFKPLSLPPQVYERYGLAVQRRYLIYVGSEDPRKNLIPLVRALAQLRRVVPDVELIKVGQSYFNHERQRLSQLATELGVQTAIHFLEDVSESDLPLLYNLSELFVTPSLYEGFGFPALEAMACGTPVVCANAGSLPEIIGDAGVQVSPCDADTLAGALLGLLRNKQKRLLLRRTGQEQAGRFTWAATIQKTAAVYEQLVPANSEGALSSHVVCPTA